MTTINKIQLTIDPSKLHQDDMRSLNAIIEILQYILPHNMAGQVEPKATILRKGMIAYADGTNWNPGAGEGVYYYNGAAWVKL